MLFHSVPHNCTAVGYLQYAIPNGFGASKMRICSVDYRRDCDLTFTSMIPYFGNKCHCRMCHIIVLLVRVKSVLTCVAFNMRWCTLNWCKFYVVSRVLPLLADGVSQLIIALVSWPPGSLKKRKTQRRHCSTFAGRSIKGNDVDVCDVVYIFCMSFLPFLCRFRHNACMHLGAHDGVASYTS